jgi:hypothetical protein
VISKEKLGDNEKGKLGDSEAYKMTTQDDINYNLHDVSTDG